MILGKLGLIASIEIDDNACRGISIADINRHLSGRVSEIACIGPDQADQVQPVLPALLNGTLVNGRDVCRQFAQRQPGSPNGCLKSFYIGVSVASSFDRPPAFLLNDHLESFGNATAFGGVTDTDLPEIARICQIAPGARRGFDAEIVKAITVAANAECADTGANVIRTSPAFSCHPFGYKLGAIRGCEEGRWLLCFGPGRNGEPFAGRYSMIIGAATEEKVNTCAESVCVICFPEVAP